MSDLRKFERAVRKAQAEAKRDPKKVLRPSQMRTEQAGGLRAEIARRERALGPVPDAVIDAYRRDLARAGIPDPLERCEGCEKPRTTTRFRAEFKAKLCDGCHDEFAAANDLRAGRRVW